jgi:predicted DNA-binding transcriptional regulator AlpA
MRDEVFITDKQLISRWQCSAMQLWRLRKRGLLPRPIKIGLKNLTPFDAVLRLEESRAENAA